MEQNLINDDLIRQLCAIHDEALSKQSHTNQPTQQPSNGMENDRDATAKSQTTWFTSLGTLSLFSTKQTLVCIRIFVGSKCIVQLYVCF